jgi:hypothetical protein
MAASSTPSADTADKRVFLHVGSPKTGSTFLQEVLWSQRQTAEDQGLLLPMSSFFDHFLGTVDLRGLAGQERFPERATGMWNRIVEAGLRWPGDVLVSHELLAAATADQAQRAVQAWGDTEVHVIVTARDLGRQIPAEWQEHLKHRSALRFAEFVDALRKRSPQAEWFWLVQDFADVCRRWSTAVPAANVHVVTVPPSGSPPELLWTRFATLIGLDPETFELTASRANASLKAEQAEMLRRVNERLGDRLPIPGPYPVTVKEVFAQDVLQGRPGLTIALDHDDRAFAIKRSHEIVSEIEQLGVDIVGDLADLVPPEEPPSTGVPSTSHPETVAEDTLLEEGTEALIGMLVRFSEERSRATDAEQTTRRLQGDLQQARAELSELRARHDTLLTNMQQRPVRQLLISLSESRPRLMRMRVHYWHAVERARRLTRRTSDS